MKRSFLEENNWVYSKDLRLIQIYLEQGERDREEGRIDKAEDAFKKAIRIAIASGDTKSQSAAMQQLIICHKHNWQNKRSGAYLDSMMEIIDEGLALDIPDSSKAGFYLRRADVSAARDLPEEALGDYQLAYKLVEKGGHTQAEFLGHLAEYEARLGAPKPALINIREAISMMWKIKTPKKRWHKWIILSGMYGRKAIVQKSLGWRIRPKVSEGIGYVMAWWLLIRYSQGQRLKQAHLMFQGKTV